jgi:hypothetical protein
MLRDGVRLDREQAIGVVMVTINLRQDVVGSASCDKLCREVDNSG